MKVLVVVPTYGRLPFLGRVVASFLGQTYEDKELVIINDDVNVTISCDEPNVICINMNKRILVGQKRNIATQVGFHDLYMHVDDDDIFLPERIANHVKIHQEHPEINLYRNTAAYTVYGNSFMKMPSAASINFVSYKRKGWFEMGGNLHTTNYGEDLYFLQNMKNVLEEWRDDQLDSVYNYGGINYHLSCQPDNLEDIARNQLIDMGVFQKEYKIIPDFEQFNNFIELERKFKEINSGDSNNEIQVEHISLGKLRAIQ
jgi:glycosyltransferase involved in cell wall biosynthesis